MSIRCRPKRTASQTNNRYVHKRTNSQIQKKKCSKPLPVGAWTSERTSINGYKWLDDSKSVGSKWLIPNTNAAGVQATAIPWNKSPQEFFKKGTSIILEREYDRDVQKSRPGAVVFALWYHTLYSNHSNHSMFRQSDASSPGLPTPRGISADAKAQCQACHSGTGFS